MGGAPPPPRDFAPQGAKNPEKFDPKRGRIWTVFGPRGQRPAGGVWGLQPTPLSLGPRVPLRAHRALRRTLDPMRPPLVGDPGPEVEGCPRDRSARGLTHPMGPRRAVRKANHPDAGGFRVVSDHRPPCRYRGHWLSCRRHVIGMTSSWRWHDIDIASVTSSTP